MLFITIFSLLLLWINCDPPENRKINSPLLHNWQLKVIKNFKVRRLARLANSFCLGNKSGLSSIYRKKFKRLGIYHLFTPSGIHLTSLLLFISPLLLFLRRRGKWWSWAIDLSLIMGSQLLPGVHSLKRVVILGVMIRRFRFKGEPLPLFTNFLLCFGLCFVLGSYHDSPISFSYSFLFLGMICSLQNSPKYHIPLALFGAQLIVSYFQGEPIFWANIFLSPVLTAIFSLCFPLVFLSYFISPSWGILEGGLQLYVSAVDWCAAGAQNFGIVVGSPLLIAGFIILILSNRWRQRGVVVAICLSLHCGELYNLPPASFKRIAGAPASNYGEIEKIRRTKRGYVVKYINGRTCYPKLYPSGLFERCRS